MVTLTPVDHDPFAQAPSNQVRLEPVDYDPFAKTDVTKNPTEQLAPASGAFPAVTQGDVDARVGETVAQGVIAPKPTPPIVAAEDPGILAESYGDTVKGLHSIKRGAFLTGYMTGAYDDVDNIANHMAASRDIEAQYPMSPQNAKAAEELESLKDQGAGGILPALGVYTRNPRFAASTAIQSLPSMLPTLVTVPVGAVAGSLAGPVGTAGGAFVGLGVGSAAADFGNAFEDYARDKWKPQTAAEWKAVLLDPAKTKEAGNYAAAHAGMVGLFDAAGGKLGGKVGMAVGGRLAEAGVGRAGRIAGGGIAGGAVDTLAGPAGEASGQLAGAGRINDPGAVAGEFAAQAITAGPTIAVEPVVHALNLGGKKGTAATAEDVTAAGAALMPAPAPEAVSGTMSAMSEGPKWYSPLRQYVEQKGPGAAPAHVWEATIRNAPGVKQEEVRDLGLQDFFADNPNKITKKELLAHLDENAIQVQETVRDNDTRVGAGNMFVPLAPGETTGPKYEGYTLPGERQGYAELTLHVPTRNDDYNTGPAGKAIRALGFNMDLNNTAPIMLERGGVPNELIRQFEAEMQNPTNQAQKDFVGGHYPEPNVVAHVRVTDRLAADGTPMALIEEIQSDGHQAGRKQGYVAQDLLAARGEIEAQRVQASRDFADARHAILGGDKSPQAAQRYVDASNHVRALEDQLAEADNEVGGRIPDMPFKTSWDELAFKRMLRWAADKGYRRIAWVNAAEQSRRYPGDAKRDAGMQQFYDRVVPSIAKRWAKRLGGTMGESALPTSTSYDVLDQNGDVDFRTENLAQANNRASQIRGTVRPETINTVVQYIDLPQAALDVIQRGLPLYSEQAGKPQVQIVMTANNTAGVTELARAFTELVKGFKFGKNISLVFHDGRIMDVREKDGRTKRYENVLGMVRPLGDGSYEIHVTLGTHGTLLEVWATLTHELGHVVMFEKFASAPSATQVAIRAAYDNFKSKTPQNQNMTTFIQRRDNAMVAFFNTRGTKAHTRLTDYGPQQRQYWASFEEWFAEQVARWATTSDKPLSLVEKFFHALGQAIRRIAQKAAERFQLPFEANKAMMDWLDSFHTMAAPFADDVIAQTNVKTQAENQRHTGPDEKAVEMQPETVALRETVAEVFNGRPPKEVQEALAYADKFNKIYKYGMGIHQVAQRNPHIKALQEYTERIAVANLTKQQVMIRAQEVLKKWNRLGGKQGDAVAALIDDVQNMVYLTPDEVKKGVKRFPTDPELMALVDKHGVTQEGLAVFKEVATTFQEHLARYEAVLRNEANKITDAKERMDRLDAITLQIRALQQAPYFPAMRFGDYTITVRNAAKQVIHFETFERERTRNAAADAIRAQYGVTKDEMELGKLDRTARPLLGVPTALLDMMEKKLTLTKAQRDALDQLKFELSPAQSFKHRFQHKRRIAGYSQDFRRAYAAYFFHGANHLMKTMHADHLRAAIKATRDETKGVYDVTTRHEIVAYMNDHVENWLDPKSDWAAIRSIAFLWALAWVPAAAAQNLTQTLMTSFPFLAAQFDDTKAAGALMRAGADFKTFYKKGTLKHATDFELRAISRGIADGIINEAMAPELAGFAEGRTLGLGFGGNELQRGIHTFNEWGAKMFELAEQVNRRLVFRATLKLAQENPGSKYVKDMVTKHKLHYEQLRQEGWTEADASAYVAARDATLTTQFQYGREYAPRFMRGKARSIFVFKTFIQNYVLFLANYPSAAVRSLLIMGFLGGLMGVPGADDLKEILKALAWRLYGKDFDIEQEARRLLVQYAGEDEFGRNAADMVLHGVARQGYGIPAFMDMIGGTVGVDVPLPTFDRSKAISAGTLLPIELGKLFGPPVQDANNVIASQAQKASGAVFGSAFNIYKAITNSKLDWQDSKRWQQAVPRSLGNLAKAYRVGTEGYERNSNGTPIMRYDVRDTEQMMEVIGMAMGYTPFRQSVYWDRTIAARDAVKLWDIQRTGLMKQMGNAVQGRDPKEIERVKGAITKFNAELPTEARGKAITSESLTQSIQTQARQRQAQEAESSVKKSDVPILREVQKLYPQSQATSVRKVRGTP